jgi:hypothetical protein
MRVLLPIIGLVLVLAGSGVSAVELEASAFQLEAERIEYAYTSGDSELWASADDLDGDETTAPAGEIKPKSPFKAFILSAAVPGLGQWYNGNKIRSFVYFGAEIATWVLHFKWKADSDDITAQFEAYNREHWSRTAYEDQYLLWTYGYNDDEDIPATGNPEISHHLPDDMTQQYYEMTGKYDQFSWGWDDAQLTDGSTLADFDETNPPPRAVPPNVPHSDNRLYYEGLRNDANNKYDNANKMIIVSIVNRLISGFEAYLTARSHNNNLGRGSSSFSRVKVRARLLSVYEPSDTPALQFTYKF